jgi:hypothetical protein
MLVNYSLKYTYILFQFQFEDFLESEFLNGQVEIIKKLSETLEQDYPGRSWKECTKICISSWLVGCQKFLFYLWSFFQIYSPILWYHRFYGSMYSHAISININRNLQHQGDWMVLEVKFDNTVVNLGVVFNKSWLPWIILFLIFMKSVKWIT